MKEKTGMSIWPLYSFILPAWQPLICSTHSEDKKVGGRGAQTKRLGSDQAGQQREGEAPGSLRDAENCSQLGRRPEGVAFMQVGSSSTSQITLRWQPLLLIPA